MKRALKTLYCLVISVGLSGQKASHAEVVKEWQFTLQHGEAHVWLSRGLGRSLSVGILGPPSTPCASVSEVTHVLTEVIKQMAGLGLDPRDLTMIDLSVEDPEVRKDVALLALRSESWKRCLKIVGCTGNRYLVDFLNQLHAFQPLDEPLSKYGLRTHVDGAEKVWLVKASAVNGLALPAGTTGTMKVPVNGNITLGLQKAP